MNKMQALALLAAAMAEDDTPTGPPPDMLMLAVTIGVMLKRMGPDAKIEISVAEADEFLKNPPNLAVLKEEDKIVVRSMTTEQAIKEGILKPAPVEPRPEGVTLQ